MRILMGSSTYRPHLNGQAIFISNLAEALVQRGHQVVVLTPDESRAPSQVNGVTVVPIPAAKLGRIHNDLYLPWGYGHLVRAQFAQQRPDLVHVHDPSPFCLEMLACARRYKVPVVAMHHTGPEIGAPYVTFTHPRLKKVAFWLGWRLLNVYLSRADLVTVPSRASVAMLAAHGLRSPALCVPCAVRLERFTADTAVDRAAVRQAYGLASDKVTLLYAGRLDSEKRVDVLLNALARVNRPDIQLALAGAGAQEQKLRQMASRLGLDGQVHFLGQVDREALPALLHSADIFVMPGDVESFSIATLEAMACARPILAANAAALPELVTHGKTGYLFRPGDAADLAQGITTLIAQRAQWVQMGVRNAQRARRYTFDRVTADYERAYRIAAECHAARTMQSQRRAPALASWFRLRKMPRLVMACLLIFLILIASLTLSYETGQAYPGLRLEDLTPLDVTETQRLLVIAPHPDDETLGAAGVIQAVIAHQGLVRVVLVTNGDGQAAGPVVADKNVLPNSNSYINYGYRRQQETLAALATLGIPEDQVDFLGYPDGQLKFLWEHWANGQVIAGQYTRATGTPYEKTYNRQAIYRGADLFQDLQHILDEFQPDLILVPHPNDTNKDHRAVGNFARFAVAYRQSQTGSAPRILGYLVHYRGYPLPRGDNQQKALLPPTALSRDGEAWLTYDLSPYERVAKHAALQMYVTQQAIIGEYIRSFARMNEIFYDLPVLNLPWIGIEQQEVAAQDVLSQWSVEQPTRESMRQLLAASSDLVSVKAVRLGNTVCVGGETRGSLSKKLIYIVRVILPDGTLVTENADRERPAILGDHFGACFDLGTWNDTPVIGFMAETRWQRTVLDTTNWHFAVLDYQN